jgi:uncharacterized membrane protein
MEATLNWADLLKLSGIAIVVVGLALRLRTATVILVAALVTGIAAGLPLISVAGAGQEGVINMLGRAFTEYRYMTLFIITLPAIGLAERYGLQEQSAAFIRRIHAATVGRLQIVYQIFRVLVGIMGVRVNGHAAFVRPLTYPMSMGAAEAMTGAKKIDDVPAETVERIKAANAASENYGNFYGQNLNPVQAGILLVASTLSGLGYTVSAFKLVLYAIPITSISIILGAIQFMFFDRKIKAKAVSDEQCQTSLRS